VHSFHYGENLSPEGKEIVMASTNEKGESRGRGFAGMDRERQRQISSQGGKAAHQKGTAHEFDSNEAREAGRKGGMVSGGRRRAREQSQGRPSREQERETSEQRERESEAEGADTGSDASPPAV
jgi:general stress protein YciG